MARNRTSLIEDLLEASSKWPWWLSMVFALGVYIFLHALALREVAAPNGLQGAGDFAVGQIVRTLAGIGQYLLPGILCVGALISVLQRKKRQRLLRETKALGSQSALLQLSWQDFERLVGEAFRQRGFSVEERGGNGPDGGVDLVLRKAGETYLVQCKHWRAYKVGVSVVRELYGVMAAQGAVGAYVVSSGAFTGEAQAFAAGRNIELIDGAALAILIDGVKDKITSPANNLATPSPEILPTCPKCGSAMVQRKARKGARAGRSFWGCSKYPACRGIKAAVKA